MFDIDNWMDEMLIQFLLTLGKSKLKIQCDESGRAVNFFWVDSRSRMTYQYFGDAVTFDTTYRTNK